MDNEKQSCCFTGHREIPSKIRLPLEGILKREIIGLAAAGVRNFYCGGAVGFDRLAGKAVLGLREGHGLRLIMAIPHRGQSRYFTRWQKQEYDQLVSLADETVCLSEHYYKGCMHARNRFMVDNSRHCICYLNGNTGGTAYTVRYAEKQALHIVNLAGHFNL